MRKIQLIKRKDRVTPVETPVEAPVLTKAAPDLCSEQNIKRLRAEFLNDLQDLRKRGLTIEDIWPSQ